MLSRLIPDKFILWLLATIAFAGLFPAQGRALELAGIISNVAIFSLFFFHGLRLERRAVWEGLQNWKLQLSVLLTSFLIMPLLGFGLSRAMPSLLPAELWTGIFFLSVLPSTVQAAIASSSMAGGNVAASVIAAAISNLAAVFLTPLLFALFASISGGGISPSTIAKVAGLLLLPFILGQFAQRWFFDWMTRRKALIGNLDRLTILFAVYVAFAAGTNEGIWSRLEGAELARLAVVVVALIAFAFAASWNLGGVLGFARGERITLFYSGAHKSLATGTPMARILFPAATASVIVIPLMMYHVLILIISAWIAVRMGAGRDSP